MSTGLMTSEGDYDPATKTYTFVAEMADPMNDGAPIAIRETVRIIDADHHVMEMFETHDGQDVRTMQIEYTRAKRSEEHTSELQSLMRISYAAFCLTKKKIKTTN